MMLHRLLVNKRAFTKVSKLNNIHKRLLCMTPPDYLVNPDISKIDEILVRLDKIERNQKVLLAFNEKIMINTAFIDCNVLSYKSPLEAYKNPDYLKAEAETELLKHRIDRSLNKEEITGLLK